MVADVSLLPSSIHVFSSGPPPSTLWNHSLFGIDLCKTKFLRLISSQKVVSENFLKIYGWWCFSTPLSFPCFQLWSSVFHKMELQLFKIHLFKTKSIWLISSQKVVCETFLEIYGWWCFYTPFLSNPAWMANRLILLGNRYLMYHFYGLFMLISTM